MLRETIDLDEGPVSYLSGDTRFTEQSDGSEVVDLFAGKDGGNYFAGLDSKVADVGFTENLAEELSQTQRYALADRLIEYHRVDLDSRADWERHTRRALVLLGIEKVDTDSLPFPGAASMQHPVIAEACVQFQANAIEEFFPATGPVQGGIAGQATPEVEEQVERAADYMNFYLTVEDEDYYADSDQMLFYLPIAGSVFRKVWIDPRSGTPRARYVKADDFVAPYFAKDLKNCPRYAHQYTMTGQEIRRAMNSGEFLDIDLPEPPMASDDDRSSMDDKSDRRVRSLHEDDHLYDILEYHVEMGLADGVDDFDDGTLDLPYIVTVDKTSREILAVRRNWKQNDPKKEKRVWFAHYKFLPGLGFYGWGFLHVIGSLAEAISGSIRVTLDSALLSAVQGGFRAKDGAKGAGFVTVEPGKYKDIDATFEELQKTFFNPPFKEPSQALPNLITGLVGDARRFASITEVLTGQATNKAPVGTTIALIEQSMKLFTAIHKRIFAAARQEFRMIAELIHDFSPHEAYPYHLDGESKQAMRSDFDERVDFLPVADPNIVSSVQRIAMAQAQIDLIALDPQLYSIEQRVEAHKRFLKALKVPDQEKIEPKIPKPSYIDPVTENARLMMGTPVRAFPGQAHELHIRVHEHQIQMAQNTLPPDQFQQLYQVVMSHIREHLALMQIEQVSLGMQQTMGVPMPPTDPFGENEDMPPEMEMAISIAASRNLPPMPPPSPLSGAAQAEQGDPAAAKAAADQQQATASKEAESVSKIERETAAFAAKSKQAEEDHKVSLRRAEELHDQKMRHEDEQAAAAILRANAEAKVQRENAQRVGNVKLAHTARQGETKLDQNERAGEQKIAHEAKREKEKAAAAKAAKSKSSGGKSGGKSR